PGTTAAGTNTTPAGNSLLGGGSGANGRSALTTQGVGTFRALDFTLTVYGCYRTGTRALCDFDITKQNNAAIGIGAFAQVAMVDDGGKITARHDAYYLSADGTQMPNAYLSTTPVRYIMEYDNIGQFSTVSLVYGNNRVQGVPVAEGGLAPGGASSRGSSGSGGGAAVAGNTQPGTTAGSSAGGNSRAAVTVPGIGSFRGGDFTLTAYGCYRNGTRILCDFDLTKQNNAQSNTMPFYTLTVVDDGGKITPRHDAYFLGADGTHMTTAFLSQAPVRYIMEYDDVAANFMSVSLVNGSDQLQGVPIKPVDATQAAGTVPNRSSVATAAANPNAANPNSTNPNANPSAVNAANATDKASQAINKATNAKAKAKSLWDQLKQASPAKPQ
ncbi:MAG TPA: hypothetical protein VJP87_12165, partial [Candidatus Acidoferrales bacterium]|nr:hypothetical protein [Candidatus Acidoferrales bacterium]